MCMEIKIIETYYLYMYASYLKSHDVYYRIPINDKKTKRHQIEFSFRRLF